jgi:hypothetical protein
LICGRRHFRDATAQCLLAAFATIFLPARKPIGMRVEYDFGTESAGVAIEGPGAAQAGSHRH